jgi:hypothetical protein
MRMPTVPSKELYLRSRMSLYRHLTFSLLQVGAQVVAAQDSTGGTPSFSGYAEAYYCYDLARPNNHRRPSFIYNHDRHNEVNINLAFLKVSSAGKTTRGSLALMAGTYAQANLAAEPDLLKMVMEANAGIRLSRTRQLWLDAGVLPSHIGFESAISKDCWNLTRSLQADNSPYYESGARLSLLSESGKLYLGLLYLNGWQRMKRQDHNNTPAFGTQITLRPSGTTMLNWSTFAGNEFPDSAMRWRYFSNLYTQLQVTPKLGLQVGLDAGIQQRSKHSPAYDVWYSPIAVMRLQVNPGVMLGIRAEMYNDKKEVIIRTGQPDGFSASGYSVNLDWIVTTNALFRIEARTLQSLDKIFTAGSTASTFFTASAAVSF